MDNIRLIATLPAAPEDVYDAWLSSHGHTAMTGGVPATSEPHVGTVHMAWAGYISGQHVELEPGRRILQTWRTTEFPESAPDSLLEDRLDAGPEGHARHADSEWNSGRTKARSTTWGGKSTISRR